MAVANIWAFADGQSGKKEGKSGGGRDPINNLRTRVSCRLYVNPLPKYPRFYWNNYSKIEIISE
jgi:hypothetical protein